MMNMMKILWYLRTRANLWRHSRQANRRLELGPGDHPIPGFETLNIVGGRWVDYVADAAKRLPFSNGTFDLVYASHILEHIPWYQTDTVLKEWTRTLKSGGTLEVWVPDGLKICRALVDFEDKGDNYIDEDGWYRFNPEKEPCKWASGRIYTYGDGNGDVTSPNWHRALFTSRYLITLFESAGLQDVRQMNNTQVRGHDHGWINLGIQGTKP